MTNNPIINEAHDILVLIEAAKLKLGAIYAKLPDGAIDPGDYQDLVVAIDAAHEHILNLRAALTQTTNV